MRLFERYNESDVNRRIMMSKRIYVGNLTKSITQDALVKMFGKFGEIEGVELSSGSAVVVMGDGAEKAIQTLHQKRVDDIRIIVKEETTRKRKR